MINVTVMVDASSVGSLKLKMIKISLKYQKTESTNVFPKYPLNLNIYIT